MFCRKSSGIKGTVTFFFGNFRVLMGKFGFSVVVCCLGYLTRFWTVLTCTKCLSTHVCAHPWLLYALKNATTSVPSEYPKKIYGLFMGYSQVTVSNDGYQFRRFLCVVSSNFLFLCTYGSRFLYGRCFSCFGVNLAPYSFLVSPDLFTFCHLHSWRFQ